MYLVDTSVWLDFFCEKANPAAAYFDTILNENLPFGITGLIYQEVLQGAGSKKDFLKLQTYLGSQKFYHPLDPIMTYRHAANLYFRCRQAGVTIRSAMDCLIAQIAIEHKLQLIHNDRDFTNMADVVRELKLATY